MGKRRYLAVARILARTPDETNPDRVAIREYGRAVGRGVQVIANYANGYADMLVRPGANTFNEYVRRAAMSGEKQSVTEADEARQRAETRVNSNPSLPTKTWTEISRAPEENQAEIAEAAAKGNGEGGPRVSVTR